jgi:hypothetical protein
MPGEYHERPVLAVAADEVPECPDSVRAPTAASASAAHPTFVVASASAPAVTVTQPLGVEGVRKLLSQQVISDVAQARREAGIG